MRDKKSTAMIDCWRVAIVCSAIAWTGGGCGTPPTVNGVPESRTCSVLDTRSLLEHGLLFAVCEFAGVYM